MRRTRLAIAVWGVLALGWPVMAHAARTVHVGVFEVEPLLFLRDGAPRGFYIDLLGEIAKKNGWTLEYHVGTWDESLERLKRGELDLLGSIAWSEQRAEVIDYTSQSVITLWSQVYVSSGSSVRNILDLEGRTVAIMKGDINGKHFVEYIDRFSITCEIVELPSLPLVFEQVAAGKVAAGVAPNVFGYARAKELGLKASPIIFAPFAVYFAVPKGTNADLISVLDATLARWHGQPDSYYHRRLAFWFGGEQLERHFIHPWVLTTLAIIGALALLLFLWNRTLNIQVRARTRELLRSEQRLRTLFEAAGDAIFVTKDGRIVECNAKTLELFRCSREQILGLTPADLSPQRQPDGRDSAVAAAETLAAVKEGQNLRFEWRHRRLDGTELDAEVSLTSSRVEDGLIHQAFVRDVTARKRLEEELRHAHKMEAIGTLAGGIAHDFNNVLSAILGFSELARLYVGKDDKVLENLEQVLVATDRARDLVQQILAFSQRTIENHQAVDLSSIVQETLQLLRSTIPATIDIESRIATPGPVRADPTGMRQIVMNLATNAYQAMGEHGHLTLSLYGASVSGDDASSNPPRCPGDYVVLEVSDSGPGIEITPVSKIFEPYVTTKDSKRGSGLGLAVVHRIVEEHEGWIDVETSPGEGATFRVWLPRSDHAARAVGAAVDVSKPTGDERILLVDDEDAILSACTTGLEQLGYRVTSYTRPEDAVAAIRADPRGFDVIITDMTMPQMTGMTLAKAARELRPEIPVILCTGYSDAVSREGALREGINAFLMKPLGPRRLALQVRELIDGPGAPGGAEGDT